MCTITHTSSPCDHICIKVETCKRFREEYDKDCVKTIEWCHRKDFVERLEEADFYIKVVACKHYKVDPDDLDLEGNRRHPNHRVRTRDRDCRNRHGPCDGVTIWNNKGVIAKYRSLDAKIPYNLSPLPGSAGRNENLFRSLSGGPRRI
jgi:hypothetical protein